MRILRTILAPALALVFIIPSFAVTDKEMDEARAIAAKAYLRYANDGSGYLDDISAKSMTELSGALKAKEKENLKAFLAVKVPSDYQSWDKAKLVEYWGVTFFKSSGLDEKGKAGRVRARKQLEAMKVASPETTSEKPAEDTPDASAADPNNTLDQAIETETRAQQEADAQPTGQDNILADQTAIAESTQEQENNGEESGHTWVYVLVLAVLVIIVIWLVVYAANLMKRKPEEEEEEAVSSRKPEPARRIEAIRETTATAPETERMRDFTSVNTRSDSDEIRKLRERIFAEENRNADLGMALEREKRDNRRMEERLTQLREENNRLKERLQEAEKKLASTRIIPHEEALKPAPMPEPEEKEDVTPEPVRPVQKKPEPKILKVIYLGRANRRGIFVRADRRITPGNTIYRLDTNDGLVGTFHVVDEPEVVDLAISNPTDNLAYGCTGEDLDDTAGVSRIITESAGTAIFENGYWKVLRKSRIRYE